MSTPNIVASTLEKVPLEFNVTGTNLEGLHWLSLLVSKIQFLIWLCVQYNRTLLQNCSSLRLFAVNHISLPTELNIVSVGTNQCMRYIMRRTKMYHSE